MGEPLLGGQVVRDAVAVGVGACRVGAGDERLPGVGKAVAVRIAMGSEPEEAARARRAVRFAGPEGVRVDGRAVEGRKDDVRDRDAGCVVDVLRRFDIPRGRGGIDGERDRRVRGGVRGEEQPARIEEVGRAVEVERRVGERLVRRPGGDEEEVRLGEGEGGEGEVRRGARRPASDE